MKSLITIITLIVLGTSCNKINEPKTYNPLTGKTFIVCRTDVNQLLQVVEVTNHYTDGQVIITNEVAGETISTEYLPYKIIDRTHYSVDGQVYEFQYDGVDSMSFTLYLNDVKKAQLFEISETENE